MGGTKANIEIHLEWEWNDGTKLIEKNYKGKRSRTA